MPHHRPVSAYARRAPRLTLLLMVFACAAAAGCGAGGATDDRSPRSNRRATASTSPADRRTPQAGPLDTSGRITNTDPCATRLHDISGALLLYYARNNDLPPALADLQGTPGVDGPASFECP